VLTVVSTVVRSALLLVVAVLAAALAVVSVALFILYDEDEVAC
jgi:hypothetical protein